MCGIFGGSGQIKTQIIKPLSLLNASRGSHSCGLAWNDGRMNLAKIAQHPIVAFSGCLAESLNAACDSGIMIGHTRYATSGKINNPNAHPFISSDKSFIFAHNGVISNSATFGIFAVDSQSLEIGIAKKDFSEYSGSIGLCWLDAIGILRLYRHNQELSYAKKDGAFYFSSDKKHLNLFGLKTKELKEDKIYSIKRGYIISIEDVPSPAKILEHISPQAGQSWLSQYENYENYDNSKWWQ